MHYLSACENLKPEEVKNHQAQTAMNYKGTKAATADVKGNLKGYEAMLI